MTERRFCDSERGVSTTLSYALNLAIAAILVSALLFAAGSSVEDQRQVAAREELRVIGQRIAAAMQQADRVVRGGTPTATEFRLDITLPRTVAGLQYWISVDQTNERLVLRTENPDLTVRIPLSVETALRDSEARGGPIYITLDSGELRIGVIS